MYWEVLYKGNNGKLYTAKVWNLLDLQDLANEKTIVRIITRNSNDSIEQVTLS